ncbi:hypothetical protein [Arthrobacter sedimenti]|uniref:hypothetical protein n=1 Tax=Arthrobacter sedimenti TaxID=2694931 RepID=UPI0014236990|nr:hypothetical protein [Arthrobacter sedimenti]
MTLGDELDLIFERRDRDNLQPTIDALLPYYASHPWLKKHHEPGLRRPPSFSSWS